MQKFAIIDVETTGGKPSDTRITEIAIFIHDGKKIVDEFSSLINPQRKIDPFVVRLTGISDKMVKNAPKFSEIAPKIIEITKNCVFVAHNVQFDYSMLKHEFKALETNFRRPCLCTVQSAKKIIPGYDSYSLGKLSKSLNIQIDGRHRATGDALATVKLFEILLNENKPLLESMVQDEVNIKNLHPQFDLDSIENIQNTAGIFSFYDENNQCIYTNKAKQLKNQILKILRAKTNRKHLKMQQELVRVEYEITGSELLAQLLFLRKKNTKYNPAKENGNFPYGIFTQKNNEFSVEKIAQTSLVPIASFSTISEAKKQLSHIQSNDFSEQQAQDFFAFPHSHFFIFSKGRTRAEKSVIYVAKNEFKAYSFLHFTEVKKNPSYIISQLTQVSEHIDDYATIQAILRKNPGLNIRKIN